MKTSIYNQHHENTEWLSKLKFYKDEIAIMQKRIDEVSAKNTSRDLSVQLTHFHNQLSIQSNTIRDLQHQVMQGEKKLEAGIASNPVAADHRTAEDHNKEREMMEGFEKNFNQLRKDLNSVVGKWM